MAANKRFNFKRILGNFPVFAEDADFKDVTTVSGKKVTDHDAYAVYKSDMAAYLEGLDKLSIPVLNGVLKLISTGLAYLHERGIPQYSLLVAYPEDAVITFKGNVYISLVADNKHLPYTNSSSKHWAMLSKASDIETVVSDNSDNAPLGTLRIVPKNIECTGYIDYKEGENFSEILYPELAEILGATQFGALPNVNPNGSTGSEELPVGTMVHSLSPTIPVGWVEFNSNTVSLIQYPALKHVLQQMLPSLPMGDVRNIWTEAINQNKLPNLDSNDFFLRASSYNLPVGSYASDSSKISPFGVLPVVVDSSNTLNPEGYSRPVEATTSTLLTGVNLTESVLHSDVVIVAHHMDNYRNSDVNPVVQVANLGSQDVSETAPKALAAKLLIKAVSTHTNPNIPITHKQVIKAFK